MKLYATDSNNIEVDYSLEQFKNLYINSSVISTESISNFFYKIKDTFHNFTSKFSFDSEEKAVKDVISNKFEVIHIANKVKMNDFRHEVISKPEGFTGLYVEYLDDLLNVTKLTHESLTKSLDTLKMGVGNFINEYQEDKVDNFYGYHYFKEGSKVIDENNKLISSYFKKNTDKVKTTPNEVLRSLKDVELLFSKLDELSFILNKDSIASILKEVNNISELIDVLLEQNMKTNTLSKNDTTKKEMIEAIEQTARSVEFYTSLYAQLLFFCNAFKSLTDALINFDSK